ncbi:hypothetical protein NE237_010481 [Protea cynaroides]|uniref:Uncharacterized protein n=1 Tax=Protea cynaroides TaxID=273540 RepID=A0A9Q0L0N3_9MAGN|nr:hypothetical protein NE237_010481 [Protea cynaroides]
MQVSTKTEGMQKTKKKKKERKKKNRVKAFGSQREMQAQEYPNELQRENSNKINLLPSSTALSIKYILPLPAIWNPKQIRTKPQLPSFSSFLFLDLEPKANPPL